jgi:hypothetical protein
MERTLKRITEKRLQQEVLKHQFLDLEQLDLIATEINLKAYISIYGLSPNQKGKIKDKLIFGSIISSNTNIFHFIATYFSHFNNEEKKRKKTPPRK